MTDSEGNGGTFLSGQGSQAGGGWEEPMPWSQRLLGPMAHGPLHPQTRGAQSHVDMHRQTWLAIHRIPRPQLPLSQAGCVCVCEKTLPLQAILRSLVQQEAQKSLGSRLAECSLVCHRGGALWTPDRGSVEQRPGGPLPVPQPLPPGSLNHNAFISH